MRRSLMVAGLIAAVTLPSFAEARDACQQRAHDRKVAGTVIGGLGGALVGNAITHDTGGTVIGGVGGAVIGNQVARVNCDRPHAAYRSSSRASQRAPSREYAPASYAGQAPACRYETRPYYDERGRLVYAPTQVCR